MNQADFLPRNERRRELLTKKMRKQKKRCYYCKNKVYISQRSPSFNRHNQATLEHLVPRSAGGCSCECNLVLACQRCNNLRGRLPIAQFLRLLRKILSHENFSNRWHDDSIAAHELLLPIVQGFERANRQQVPPTITWPSSPR